jgi:MFS family permease
VTTGTRGTSRQAAAERRGLLLAFAAFGSFWGAWSATLPDIREQAGVTDGELGLALAAVAAAAVPAMPLAGRLIDRHGARRLLPPALVLFAAGLRAAGLRRLAAAARPRAARLGASTGGLDVFLNATTATWERLEGRRLMAGAHGCFSLGVLVASVGAGIAQRRGGGPRSILGTSLALVLLAAATQPSYRDADPSATTAPLPRVAGPGWRPSCCCSGC